MYPRFRGDDKCYESGNVLILILVAIALMAALTMTIMRSDSTDADSVAPEQARVMAAQILSQARAHQQAVQTLIQKGCSEQTISFENDVVAGYANAGAPVDESCHVFKRAGAGLAWPLPPTNANDGSAWRFLGGNAVGGVTRTDDGTCVSGCIDFIAVLPNVSLNVCKQLNGLAGTTAASAAPPVDSGDFDGTTKIAGFDADDTGEPVLDGGATLSGAHTGCFEATNVDGVDASGTYWFYHVMVVR